MNVMSRFGVVACIAAAGLGAVSSASAGVAIPEYVNGWGQANNEAGYVNLQWPPTMNVLTGTPTPLAFGQIWQPGVTEPAGPSASIVAQFGYGPFGSNPLIDDSGWTWFATTYNVQVGNNDEYMCSIIAPAPGVYAYTFRYNTNPGYASANVGWTLGDLNGAGFAMGPNAFDPNQLGVMTVTPAPGAAALVGLAGLAATRRRR